MSSLQERLAARREQLQQERFIQLPVPGYEDLLVAKYRVLGRRELKGLAKKNSRLSETEDFDLIMAADTMIRACVELLEAKGDGEYVSTGKKWDRDGICDLFGLELPAEATTRDALLAVMPPTETELLVHFNEYDNQLTAHYEDMDEEILGESEAAPEAALSN